MEEEEDPPPLTTPPEYSRFLPTLPPPEWSSEEEVVAEEEEDDEAVVEVGAFVEVAALGLVVFDELLDDVFIWEMPPRLDSLFRTGDFLSDMLVNSKICHLFSFFLPIKSTVLVA